LNIFGDRNITIEDLMHERGQLVKKGTLSEDGDLEFWEDGSVTQRGEGAGKAEAKNNRGKEEGAGVDSSTREK
jgi:protein import protein ZIM17